MLSALNGLTSGIRTTVLTSIGFHWLPYWSKGEVKLFVLNCSTRIGGAIIQTQAV